VSDLVLDASAVLALINREPGWEAVAEMLDTAVISTVNISEVVAKLADRGLPAGEIRTITDALAIKSVDFDESVAHLAGLLRPATRGQGLSLGDRACLALAMQSNATAVTCDRSWTESPLEVDVLLIRDV
jgi:PIN domain nuclease of toxin-antitoxin system